MKSLALLRFLLLLACIQFTNTETSFSRDVDPWCNTLTIDGDNYWRVRVPIEIMNMSKDSLIGSHIRIVLSNSDGTSELIGEDVGRLRLADADATELLFDLETESGTVKHEGSVVAGDVMIIPATAAGESYCMLYIYGGNPDAWLLPDMGDFGKWAKNPNHDLGSWLGEWGSPEPVADQVEVRVLPAQKRELKVIGAGAPWIEGEEWEYRIPLKVRNYEKVAPINDLSQSGYYFIVNTRKVYNRIIKLLGFQAEPSLRLVDPRNPDLIKDLSGDLKEHIISDTYVAPETEQILYLYISADPDAKGKSNFTGLPYGNRGLGWSTTDTRAGRIEARKPKGNNLAAWPVNSLVKVFRDDLPPENPENSIKVYAARNSYKAFQLIVRSTINREVNVKLTQLKGPGGKSLASPKIARAGFVPADVPVLYTHPDPAPDYHRVVLPTNRMSLLYKNSSLLRPTGQPLTFAETGGWTNEWWPDPLIPVVDGSSIKLDPGIAQPLWFDIHIPAGAEPGLYKGEVEISDNQETLRIPLEIKVWKATMPVQRNLPAMYELRVQNEKGGSSEEAWFRFMTRYNLSPCYSSRAPEYSYKKGKLVMNTKEFDRVTSLLIDELHVKYLWNPLGAYGPRSKGYKPEDFKDAYRLFIEHVTEKGWRDNFIYYIVDEPGNVGHRGDDVWERTVERADIAREIAPDVMIYVSTWHYFPVLVDHINTWGIGPESSFPRDRLAERRKAGDRFLYTTDGLLCLDTPYLAFERLLPWFAYKNDVLAYEYWDIGWWTIDPWKYGWHATKRRRLPNGDGYSSYPGTDLGLSEPVPSIRLVAAREGVDDHEIFLKLDKLAEAGNPEAQEALERIKGFVITPNMTGLFSTDVMPDPDAVREAWINAGEILDQFIQE